MKVKLISTLIALVSIVSISNAAPKGAEVLAGKGQCATVAPVDPGIVKSGNTILASHTKAIGTVGKTGRYTIVKASARSVFDPNLTALFIYDADTDSIIPLGTASGNGIGHTILSAGAPVAAAALIRPPTTRINNDSGSYSGGGAGGNAGAVSYGSTATSTSTSRNVNVNSANAKNDNASVNVNSAATTQSQGQGQDQGQWQQNSNWQQQQKNDYKSPQN